MISTWTESQNSVLNELYCMTQNVLEFEIELEILDE